ncbi:MAG: Mrp/NBP35 family ATP-binding protein [Planctomycetota bacterium]|jgi:ATP-binding protein involved in chromosome partitioning
MALTEDLVRDALRTVNDPDLHRDLVTLGMVKAITIDGTAVTCGIELTTPACPMKDRIRGDIEQAITLAAERAGEPLGPITVDFTADVRSAAEKMADRQSPLPEVKHVIAVGAGKGGVGKSTVATCLAVGLARHGAAVGLLDGDIYGPSMTTMLGLDSVAGRLEGNMLMPFEVHGIKAMTIGKLVEPEKALIWRGPMAHGAFKQLATQTEWGPLDYLIVDLPPGTGDVPLTLAQLLPLTGSVVVCTPQKVAQDDARRAIRMFEQLGVPSLGVVENMSGFTAPDGTEFDIFGRGGAEMLAQAMNVPYLGSLPIDMDLRSNADAGTPSRNWDENPTLGGHLDRLVQNLASQVSIATMRGSFVQPTLSIN